MKNKPATCSFLSKPKKGVTKNSQKIKKQAAKIDWLEFKILKPNKRLYSGNCFLLIILLTTK